MPIKNSFWSTLPKYCQLLKLVLSPRVILILSYFAYTDFLCKSMLYQKLKLGLQETNFSSRHVHSYMFGELRECSILENLLAKYYKNLDFLCQSRPNLEKKGEKSFPFFSIQRSKNFKKFCQFFLVSLISPAILGAEV